MASQASTLGDLDAKASAILAIAVALTGLMLTALLTLLGSANPPGSQVVGAVIGAALMASASAVAAISALWPTSETTLPGLAPSTLLKMGAVTEEVLLTELIRRGQDSVNENTRTLKSQLGRTNCAVFLLFLAVPIGSIGALIGAGSPYHYIGWPLLGLALLLGVYFVLQYLHH